MPLGFLTSLNINILRLIHIHAANSKTGILLIAKDEQDNCCGFITGAIDTSMFYKTFIRAKGIQAFIYLYFSLFSIKNVIKIFETLLYPKKKELLNLPKAELLDFAIKKSFRGTGLAQKIYNAFVCKLDENNITDFKITTGEKLIPAQKFYEKMGAKKTTEIVLHKGQKTYVYIYKINRGENDKKSY